MNDSCSTGKRYAGLSHSTSLKTLRRLSLPSGELDDGSLEYIKALVGLEELNVQGNSKMTDAGVAKLGGLANLRELDFGGDGRITGGVAHFKGLRNLCFLEIYKVGPSDLLALKDLPRLEHLEIGEFGPGPWKADLSVLRGLRWLDITYADGEIPGQGRLPADLRRLDMPCRAAAQLDLQSAEQISELHLYIGLCACRR